MISVSKETLIVGLRKKEEKDGKAKNERNFR